MFIKILECGNVDILDINMATTFYVVFPMADHEMHSSHFYSRAMARTFAQGVQAGYQTTTGEFIHIREH